MPDAGGVAVDVLLAELAAAVREVDRSAVDAVEAEETLRWKEPLRAARAALAETAGTTEGAGASPEATFRYAASVADRVLAPLLDAAGGGALARTLDAEVVRASELTARVLEQIGSGDETGRGRPSTPGPLRRFGERAAAGRARAGDEALRARTAEVDGVVRAVGAWWLEVLAAAGARDPADRLRSAHAELAAAVERTWSLPGAAHALARGVEAALREAEAETRKELAERNLTARLTRRGRLAAAGLLGSVRRSVASDDDRPDPRWEVEERLLLERLALAGEVCRFAAAVHGLAGEALEREVDGGLADVRAALAEGEERLRELLARAEAAFRDGVDPVPEVRRLLADGRAAIQSAVDRLAGDDAPGTLVDAADRLVGRVLARVGALPEEAVVGEPLSGDPAEWPAAEPARLTPREWAQRAFDVPTLELVRGAAVGVAEAVRRSVEVLRQAETVLAYNLEAAVDELEAPSEEAAAPSGEVARELVLGGLDRTGDHFVRMRHLVADQRDALTRAARVELGEALARFGGRLALEDRWSAELADAWAELSARAARAGSRLRSDSRTAAGRARALLGDALARARGLLRRSRRALGLESASSGAADTLRALSVVDAAAADLPFVYRRLFAARPLDDPSLVVERGHDLDVLRRHHEDWLAGRAGALVLTGPFRGGLRTLVGAFEASLGAAGPIHHASLDRRPRSEAELAGLLARALPGPSGTAPASLDELAEAIAAPTGGDRLVVHLSHLEHLFLRTVLDPGWIARTFEFFARTDERVLWLVSLSEDAWQLASRVEPGAAGLVRTHAVAPLSRDGVRDMLLARHQRSGLVLHFDASTAPPSVRRRLARIPDPEARRAELEEACFEELHELTDGSASLALLYWLRSARFSPGTDAEGDEAIEVAWPAPIDFGFLDGLRWDQVFALKAFVDHATLTVEEHAAVFGTPVRASHEVFESLGDLLLIEDAAGVRRAGERLGFSRVLPGVRYRLRPALVAVVRRVLVSRHVVE